MAFPPMEKPAEKLGLGKKKPSPLADLDMDMDMGAMEGDAKEEAAQAILDAFDARDAAALNEALSAHYDLCASKASSEEDDETEY